MSEGNPVISLPTPYHETIQRQGDSYQSLLRQTTAIKLKHSTYYRRHTVCVSSEGCHTHIVLFLAKKHDNKECFASAEIFLF